MAWKLSLRSYDYWYDYIFTGLSCCDLCGQTLTKSQFLNMPIRQSLLCQYCLNDLTSFKQELIDGDLLNWPAINKSLPNISFDHLCSLSPYSYPFDKWLAQLKYLGRFELAKLFAALLCVQWQVYMGYRKPHNVDLVISVPLHIKKWQHRGYNQAHLIAKQFAQLQDIPYDGSLFARIKNNDSQMGKTGAQRRKNLSKAFSLQKRIMSHIKHVVIIDDVVTTGTTASEISKILKSAGVEKVTLLTVCLTLPKVLK